MSWYSCILVLYYAHYAINFDENTFYFNFTTTFTTLITFSFSNHYYVHYAVIKTKKIIFLVNNKINLATTFTAPGSWKITYCYTATATTTITTCTTAWFWQKKIILTFTTFIFLLHPRLLLPSPCHDQDNSFFISLLPSYVMIKRKIISLVTTFTTPRP